MHKDHKHKKAAIVGIQSRELRQEKRVDPKVLERFKEKPYQMRYEEMMKERKLE